MTMGGCHRVVAVMLLASLTCITTTAATTTTTTTVDHGAALTEWLRKHPDGFLHDHLEIRKSSSDDDSSDTTNNNFSYGMYATQLIPRKTTLFTIPRALLYVPDEDELEDDSGEPETCATARTLYHELVAAIDGTLLVEHSDHHAPYVQYLKEQPHGQLPSAWSDAGQTMLKLVTGRDPDFVLDEGLGMTDLSYQHDCLFQPEEVVDDKEGQELLNHAYLMVLQRGWDQLLIPVYDMLSHANGARLLNTELMASAHDPNEDIVVQAIRTIQPGEQLYTTYDMCRDCDGRWDSYGVPEMLRDYGFVEQFPQRWIFGYDDLPGTVAFVLDQASPGETIRLQWLSHGYEEEFHMRILKAHLHRLQGLELEQYQDSVKHKHEYETVVQFHKAVVTALTMAIDQAQSEQEDTPISDIPQECSSSTDETTGYDCSNSRRQYDNLLVPQRLQDRDFESYQCFFGRTMEFPGYVDLEVESSQYQEIHFYMHPQTRDVCFNLDNIVQMCGSYRPHYHELVVHNTARYVKNDVKRVVWVGGGDSMLLHEILKYPTLELVVGLEIDQKVTRKSFKHFGTQPHWDQHEKVQWWYGDASKTLLMLPKEYFGSFDMVLVDLSETITSALVTEGLDIMAALGLLLQPEGILVKNEVYFEKMSSVFDHTVQLKLLDIPVICTQALSIGSPGLDFVNTKPKDHGILDQNLVITPSHKQMQGEYDFWHDYYKNEESSFRKHCKAKDDEPEPEPVEQLRSPGILMILEAEDVTVDLGGSALSSSALKGTVEDALKTQGLGIVSTVSPEGNSDDGSSVLVTILQEGYVVSRTWAKNKYIAFDVFLWSSFDKHEAIKNAILSAVGSKSSSAYRIVTGGMFGVSTWKDDEQKRGPVYQPCNHTDMGARSQFTDRTAIDTILSESLSLLQGTEPAIAVVVCGEESTPCNTLDVVSNHGKIGKTVVIRACAGVKGGSSQEMVACEMDTWQALLDAVKDGKKLAALVLDDNAPYFMAQIALKIFLNHKQKEQLIGSDCLILAPMVNTAETWRRNFLHRFGQDVFVYEPSYRSEVLFNSTESSMEMGLTAFGDPKFIEHVLSVVNSTEEKTGLASDVQFIEGGIWRYYADFEPSQFLLPKDYDQSAPFEQWKSQKPLGRQTVLQFEMQPINAFLKGDRVESFYRPERQWLPGTIAEVNSDGTYDVRYDDGEIEMGVTLSVIRKLKSFREGDRVLGNFEQGDLWFPGTVAAVNRDGTYDVRYVDQDFESGVDVRNLREVEGSKPEAMVQPPPLSQIGVKEALENSLQSVDAIHDFGEVGDGCVFVAIWSGGSAVAVWDGRVHVDVNLFTFSQNVKFVNDFQRHLTQHIPFLQLTLRDEQPRGFGRVVNFSVDIQQVGSEPHWALDMLTQ